MSGNQLIHEFMKNSAEKVKVEFSNFNGKELFDIRIYFNAKGADEDWRPTKKGVALSLDLVPELRKAIEKAQGELEKKSEQSDS